ncbi:MAG: esterase-like activity of phytase family protein [Candidatus Sedimenticola sp. (ex Thyasira tokunagai)]
MSKQIISNALRNIFLCCLLSSPLTLQALEIGTPITLSDQVASNDEYMKLQLRGVLTLKGDASLAELSDLAWDEDEQILYGITDRGRLLHLQPRIEEGILLGMELLTHYPLLEKSGKATSGSRQDAEGLTLENSYNGIRGDSRLLVSFERDHRIIRHMPDGRHKGQIDIPPGLKKPAFRPTGNKGMEALTLHPKFGVITGTEKPQSPGTSFLFSSKGKQWSYAAENEYSALVSLETLPDGGLLILQRAYRGLLSPLVITLSRIRQQELELHQRLSLETVAQFDTTKGWRTQNFEGLTRHQGKRFFMVSDDNNMPWASTQLVYFELHR